MKFFSILILLALGLGMHSCEDKNAVDIFEPSLSLDEYALMNFNGVERIYHTDENLNEGVFTYFNSGIYNYDDGRKEFYLSFGGEPQTYSGTYLRLDKAEVGAYTSENLHFSFIDYSLTENFEMMQTSCADYECLGEMDLVIHNFGDIGEKVMGEFSGAILKGDGSGETNNFNGEFVVYLDEE